MLQRLRKNTLGLKALLLIGVSALLISCETVSYYSQAARGQMAIVFGREDIQRLISSEDTNPELQQTLEAVMAMREFAEAELLLPVGDNYLSYVDVEREHVVWNVFAAPEFSTDSVNWCYPIAGCVSYRGYFSESAAVDYAQQMADDGFDVYTGGVDAYSTLGWFDDSLLSTVLNRAEYQLAGLIFHELAHQRVYLPGDTTFNESFATAVEREGLRRWLLDNNQQDTIEIAQQNRIRQQKFIELVTQYRDRFDALYEEPLADDIMRLRKSELQQQMRAAYEAGKQHNGYGGYDTWFSNSLNNAQLSTVGSYNDLVPFFNSLLAESGNDLSQFYEQVQLLAEMDEEARDSRLGR